MNQEFNKSNQSNKDLARVNTKLELMKLAHAAIAEVELLENQVSVLQEENQALREKQGNINIGHNIFANEINMLRDTTHMLHHKNQSLGNELARLREVHNTKVLDLEKEITSLRNKLPNLPEVEFQLGVLKEANDAIMQENDELKIVKDNLEAENSLLNKQLDEVNNKLFMTLLDKQDLEDKVKGESLLMELLDAKLQALFLHEKEKQETHDALDSDFRNEEGKAP